MHTDIDALGTPYSVHVSQEWPQSPALHLEPTGEHLHLDRESTLRLIFHLTDALTRAEREADQ